MKKTLRKLKRIFDPFFRKYIDTFIWRFRHYLRSDWQDGYLDTSSLEHPHRKLIVNAIRQKSKVESLLELGTGSGINLVMLKNNFPDLKCRGIDINSKAIQLGKKYLTKNSIAHIVLETGNIFDVTKMASNSVDIILTDAVLMYIDKKDLETLLSEMLRVSKMGLILCEQISSHGVYHDHWRHDYDKILYRLASVKNITQTKITEDYWTGDWIKYGYLIEVEKKLP